MVSRIIFERPGTGSIQNLSGFSSHIRRAHLVLSAELGAKIGVLVISCVSTSRVLFATSEPSPELKFGGLSFRQEMSSP